MARKKNKRGIITHIDNMWAVGFMMLVVLSLVTVVGLIIFFPQILFVLVIAILVFTVGAIIIGAVPYAVYLLYKKVKKKMTKHG